MSEIVKRLLDDAGDNDRYSVGYFDGHRDAREHAQSEIERLQAVLDAAREACLEVINAQRIMEEVRDTADDILRALDGEVKP